MPNCAAKGCGAPLADEARMMCGRCWGLVPSDLQSRVSKAWEAITNGGFLQQRSGKTAAVNEFNHSRAAAIDAVAKIEDARKLIAQGSANVITGRGQRVFPLLIGHDAAKQIGMVILNTDEFDKQMTENVLVLGPAWMVEPNNKVHLMGFGMVPTPPGWKT